MQTAEYAALAAVEDRMWYFRALHRLVEGGLVRALGRRPGAILDAGCGTGGLIRRVGPRRPHWTWTGIDVSPLACELARRRTAAEIVEGSVTRLPFAADRFDAVVLSDVLYHLDDDQAALRECRRVLRPGGVVLANVPAYPWLWSYHDRAVAGKRRYGRSTMVARLEQDAWTDVWSTHWNTLLLPLVVLRRKVLPPPRSGSDVRKLSPTEEAAGRAASALEYGWICAFGSLPFGVSIFVFGRKPA